MAIGKIAWKNVTRAKKQFRVSVLSVLLGAVVTMGAVVIMRGTDRTNLLEGMPDFQVGILAGVFRFPDQIPEKVNDDTQILSADLVETMEHLEGIETQTIEITRGSYAVVDYAKDEALSPKRESLEAASDIAFATIQIVDEEFVAELQKYVKERGLTVDLDSFSSGEGCILLHHNELSQTLARRAETEIGKPVHFYSLNAYADAAGADAYEKGRLICSGYLDMTDKYFPELQMTSITDSIDYFIVTEEGFEKLGFSEKMFDISFDAQEEERTRLNQMLAQLIQRENRFAGEMDTYYLSANYTLLQSEQNAIRTSNTMLGVLAALICFVGILNYMNTLYTNYEARRKELAVMRSVGLTARQMRRMFLAEGFWYWCVIVAEMLVFGSAGVYVLGKLIRIRLLYFQFFYPWKCVLALAAVMLAVNLIFSQAIGRREKKESLREQLKKGTI